MSASWPTSVATDSNLYVGVNELQNNLSAGINNAVTTVGINSTTGFPTVGLVLIDNEVIKYTGISGNNLTGCTRGFDGTTAASHSSSAVVSFAICADHHNVLKNEIEAIETYLSNNLGTGSQPLATGSRALASSAGGKISESSVTATELGYLSGVTSAIQTQLATKVPTTTTVNGHALSGNVTVTASDVSALPTVGGTMSGAIAMGANKITGIANGTAATDAAAFGQILAGFQAAVFFQNTTNKTTTSSTFADTALAASIAPTSASNRIKITVTALVSVDGGSTNVRLTLKRGSTNVAGGTVGLWQSGATVATGGGVETASFTFYDSPATTSSTTYTLQIASSDNATTVEYAPGTTVKNSIILEEVV